ncbi:MAG TPA: DUF433 domain-containing protein [Stellaceae bacterium]|nr:DUF433 domain-containing protein [Stellaceae bacterium]
MPASNLLKLTRKEIAALRAASDDSIALYRRGLGRVESRPDVLGGEPVFKGTRLSVRHIGGMILAGVPKSEIRADYPQLSLDDIAFAALFAGFKPLPGRSGRRLRLVRADAG